MQLKNIKMNDIKSNASLKQRNSSGCCCIQTDFKNASPNQIYLSETEPHLLILPGPEYGTTEAAWKAVLVEADRRCELHIKVKDNLLNEVSSV